MPAELLSERQGSTLLLTISDPATRNALSPELYAAGVEALSLAESDAQIRCVVLTGAAGHFSAGGNLSQMQAVRGQPERQQARVDALHQWIEALRSCPKPVIAALNGVTMAGGLEMAMCADIVIAAESAVIGDAHANFGVYPGAGGAAVLPRIIPQNVAMYLLLTGKTLSAAEMKAYGFVSEVHPDGELADAAMKLAGQIAAKSPIVLRRMREVARTSADKSRDDALLHEQVMLRRHLRSFDLQEGLLAFAEKRAPQFQGR